MNLLRSLGLSSLLLSSNLWAVGNLEVPQSGSIVSGIGVISGWQCDASDIAVEIDGGVIGSAPAGGARSDTQFVCGDTDNGFTMVINWSSLGDGTHTVRVYADGVEFASVAVDVVTLGTSFLTNASGYFSLSDFPEAGNITDIKWSEPVQNFVVSNTLPVDEWCSGDVVIIEDEDHTLDETVACVGSESLAASSVTVGSGANVHYYAPIVTLGNNFQVVVGGFFRITGAPVKPL